MQKFKLVVYGSRNKYWLTYEGKIEDSSGNEISWILKDGIKTIKLDWLDGEKFYHLDLVIALSLFNIKLPERFWDKIELIYTDGDSNNLCLKNLSYRFKDGPIETLKYPGFYYIPYYTSYAVNREGVLLNLANDYFLTWTILRSNKAVTNSTGGYLQTRCKKDVSETRHVLRHRIVALTFLYYHSDPFILVVNHKDGVPGNDDISNLEWVTKAENNQHAYDYGLFPNKVKPILLWDTKSNIVKGYRTIAECVKENNLSESFVYTRMNKTKHIQYSDGLRFKLDDGSEWCEQLETVKPVFDLRPVSCRNIFSGEVSNFKTKTELANFTGISKSSVGWILKNSSKKPHSGFNIRFTENDSEWPSYTSDELLRYK